MGDLARGDRLQIMLADDELEAVDDWRFAKRGPVLRASADGQSRIERRRRVSLPDENGSGGE